MELQLTETDQGKTSLICDGYIYYVDKINVKVTGNFLALLKWVKNLAENCPLCWR
jgi:hypothetical protein